MDGSTPINSIAQFMWATANEQQKSLLHALSAGELYNDFCTLQRVLTFYSTTSVPQRLIDNAEEYYKQMNKALLFFRDLNPYEKQNEELRIDAEARRLKNNWISALRSHYIQITP